MFPALLPFFICCGLLEKLGFLSLFHKSKRFALMPIFLFGALAGYPSGARLLGSSVEIGTLSKREAQTMSYISNLCSPAFLMTIISCGLYKNKRVFFPLFAAHILSVLIFAVFLKLPKRKKIVPQNPLPLADAITTSITDGMTGILKVGGCVVFCSVISTVLFSIAGLTSPLLRSIIGGCIEMTYGCNAIASSGLPLKLQLAICAFLIGFGGLSIALQSLCFLPLDNTGRYIGVKFLMGLCCGILAYLFTPIFVSEPIVATLAMPQAELINALTTGGLLFCSIVGLSFVMLFSVIVRRSVQKKRTV